MHLAHKYALSCGAKISRPEVPISYYPITEEKYICISTSAEVNSKKYDYFQQVLDHIIVPCKEHSIAIMQVGHGDDAPLEGVGVNLGTSAKQLNYILQNCQGLISNEHYCAHAASIFDKKIVTLFGPLYQDISKPFWGDPSNQVFLESHRNGEKPSFTGEEADYKRINLIKPEEVAKNILNLLEIPHDLESLETLHIGPYFNLPILEGIPNFEPNPEEHKGAVINMRLDLHDDPEIMTKWAFNRKLNIVTDHPLKRKYLDIIKPHVTQVMMDVTSNFTEEDIRSVQAGGYNTYLFTTDPKKVKELRLSFIDWDINLYNKTRKKDLDNASKICDNTCFKSSKTLMSKNKSYSSTASWLVGVEKHTDEQVIDSNEFWEESEYFRLYNK